MASVNLDGNSNTGGEDGVEVQSNAEHLGNNKVEKKAPFSSSMNGKPTFANLFKNNRVPDENAMLHFIPFAGGEFRISFDEIDTVEDALGYCLVGCGLGNKPNPYSIRELIKKWGMNVKFRVHANGWIAFTFPSEEDRDNILHGGPYMIYGKQLYLKLMPRCFLYRVEDMFFMPTWVQIHGLPADCWTHKVLSRLASVIGKPVHMDKVTHYKGNTQFARVLVEFDASVPRIHDFEITLPTGQQVVARFVYEGDPKFFEECQQLGHDLWNCKKRIQREKGKEKVVEEEVDCEDTNMLDEDSEDVEDQSCAKFDVEPSDVGQTLKGVGGQKKKKKNKRKAKKNRDNLDPNPNIPCVELNDSQEVQDNIPELISGDPNIAAHVPQDDRKKEEDNQECQPINEIDWDSSEDGFKTVGKKGKTVKKDMKKTKTKTPLKASSSCETEFVETDPVTGKPKVNGKSVWMTDEHEGRRPQTAFGSK